MTRQEKDALISDLADRLSKSEVFYLTDISSLNAENSGKLRRLCFQKEVQLKVVKNTLLSKAMDRVEGKDFSELKDVLKGNTGLMIAETSNGPAKLIKEFRKKSNRPILKGAYIEESIYVGDESLEMLANLKSKDELIGDIVLILQLPAQNVISGLKSGGGKLAGILKTLEERAA